VLRPLLFACGLAWLAWLGGVGCAATQAPPDGPGLTRILLENQVESPCELTWVSVRVDGRPMDRVTIAPSGEDPVPLDPRLALPGRHEVAVGARATCPGRETTSVLQVSQPIYMGEPGGAVSVRLTSDAAAPSGLAVSFALEGGRVFSPRADGAEPECAERLPLDAALCRGERELASAEAARDPSRVLCVTDKLREMRLLSATTGPVGGAPDPAIQARILALAEAAERCAPNEAPGPDGTRVVRVPAAPAAPR
jgi:hypothetical protein